MKKYLVLIAILIGCTRNPVTNRSALTLVPNSEVLSMAQTSYTQFLSENKASTDAASTAMVQRVGKKIADAVNSYLINKNLKAEAQEFKWEFNLIEDPQANAWCMPGGKVVVYTGILPYTQNESGLAVVLGHEIAHAVAKHGNERMSQGLIAQFGGMALQVALKNKPAETQQLFYAAYGVGSNVGVLLPFSRKQESEADYMGLIFMAMAGYDPTTAVQFWQRMAQKSGSNSTPEFLSTHPSDQKRIADIQKNLPVAMGYYKK